MGVAAAKAGIPRVIRQVIRTLSEEEILKIVDFVSEMLIRDPEDAVGASPPPI